MSGLLTAGGAHEIMIFEKFLGDDMLNLVNFSKHLVIKPYNGGKKL